MRWGQPGPGLELSSCVATIAPTHSAAIVAGNVEPDGFGWHPYIAALTPAEVVDVADDLEAIANAELAVFCEVLEEDDAD